MLLKKYSLPFLVCCILILSTACEKEAIVQPVYQLVELSTEEYLARVVKEPVIFLYSQHNEADGAYRGWFIDKTGVIKTFRIEGQSLPLTGDHVTDDALTAFSYQGQTTDKTVSLDELVAYHKKINKASKGSQAQHVTDEEAESTSSYVAFRQSLDNGASGCSNSGCQRSCSNNSAESYQSSKQQDFNRIILESEGFKNTAAEANQISDWLREINASLQ